MCMYCKNDTLVESTTTHVVNYKNCTIIIKNVPCRECSQCGEKYYTDEVSERLEQLVAAAKKTSLDKGTQRKTTENELPSLTQCTA